MLEDAVIQLNQKRDVYVATMILEDMIKKFPESELVPQARLLLGQCYLQERQFNRALDQLETVLQAEGSPGSPLGYQATQGIIATYWQEGRKDEALQYALTTSDTLRLASIQARAAMQMQIIRLYIESELIDEARDLILRRLRDPAVTEEEHGVLFQHLADSVYKEDKAALLAVVREYIGNHPDSDTADNMRYAEAGLLKELGRVEEAEQLYRNVMTRLGERIEGLLSADEKIETTMIMAHMKYGWGEKDQAREHLDSLIRDFPMSPRKSQVMMQLAEFYHEKDGDRTRSLLEQIIREFPDQRIAQLARWGLASLDAATTGTTPGMSSGMADPKPASQPLSGPVGVQQDAPTSATVDIPS